MEAIKKNSRNVLDHGGGMIISSLQLPNLAVSNNVFGRMYGASLEAQRVKNPPTNAGDVGSIPGPGRSLEEEMATCFNILAWEIPWTEEPGGLKSTGLQESYVT